MSGKLPNLTKVLSFSGTRFLSATGCTAGELKDFSMFSTAAVVTSRFHLPFAVLKFFNLLVTVAYAMSFIAQNALISVAVNSEPKDAFNFEIISSVVILIVNGT